MERKAAKAWTIIALLLMSMALMANASTEKTGGTAYAPTSFSTTSAPPPTEWNQTYVRGVAYSIVKTSDGGYAMAGSGFQLVKTDSAGNMQWNQTYGGAGIVQARSVVQASGGGYALAGYTNSTGAGGVDFWLVDTNATGDKQWSQTYGGLGDDYAYSVVRTSDGGYAMAGYTNSYGAGSYDAWLVKTDSAGNMQWNQYYGGANDDRAYSVIQTSDGGYALAGFTYDSSNTWDFWLVKTNSTGGMQWDQPYGGADDDEACSVVQTSDGGYALAGFTYNFGGNLDAWLVRTNTTGGMLWNQMYEGSNAGGSFSVNFANSLIKTSDGGYAMAGTTSSFGAGGWDFWLVKTDSFGNVQWNQTYGGAYDDEAYSVVRTSDGGYAMAGYTTSSYGTPVNFYLVKARSCTLTITVNTPTGGTTNPTPENYSYSVGTVVTVNATPNDNYIFDHWMLDGVSNTTNPISVQMNTDHSLQAFFTSLYTLTILATAGGTTNPTPGTYVNSSGTIINVTALPYNGFLFEYWGLDSVSNTTNPISITMNANHSLQAFFTSLYTLTILATAGGTTNPTPGTYVNSSGTIINVTASPDTGHLFGYWMLDGVSNTTNPISITMNKNHTLTAHFALQQFVIIINATTGGTTSPSGWCIYPYGYVVNVTASPNTGYYLCYWILDSENVEPSNPISITMTTDHTLTANFTLLRYTITINATAGGTTSPSGTFIYPYGTIVNVTALPNTGFYFDHWMLDGVDIGISDQVNITMDANHTMCGVFNPYSPGDDVAMNWIDSPKIVIGKGYSSTIKVHAMNVGSYNETFNLKVYANDTATGNTTCIAILNVTLPIHTSANLTFDWNTAGLDKGNYTLSAYVEPVPGETNTADNNFTGGWVMVATAGDLTGGTSNPWNFVPDGKVDGKDITIVALCYGAAPGCQAPWVWNINSDVNNDGKIDGKDITLVALHYGQADP